MAKNYRSILYDGSVDLGAVGAATMVAEIKPIDSQQSLGAYLSNIKVSVSAERIYDNPVSYLIFASSDASTLGVDDVITAAATGVGGGTVNLSLKRNVRDDEDDPSRSDGPVSIWIEASADDGSIQEDQFVSMVVEAWGRFIEVGQ